MQKLHVLVMAGLVIPLLAAKTQVYRPADNDHALNIGQLLRERQNRTQYRPLAESLRLHFEAVMNPVRHKPLSESLGQRIKVERLFWQRR